jgi:hypothetical protein
LPSHATKPQTLITSAAVRPDRDKTGRPSLGMCERVGYSLLHFRRKPMRPLKTLEGTNAFH